MTIYKSLFAVFFVLPVLAYANTASDTPNNQPMLALTTADQVDGKLINLSSTTTHQSRDSEHLCWIAANLPVQANRPVVEILTGPSTFKMYDDTATVTQRGNQVSLQWVITEANDTYYKCYNFNAADPIGDYTIQVQIGDLVFGPLNFRVAP